MIVGIDGPAGSGKGTVTKEIAKRMGLVNFDTGATYRCVALESIRKGIPLTDEKGITNLIDSLNIEFEYDEDENIQVFLNGEDVTKLIREKEVNELVSQVSHKIEVRENITNLFYLNNTSK